MDDESYIPPPRSLLWAKPVQTEHGPGIDLGCDCGNAYILVIDGADQLTAPRDIATTCDGCNSVRWITVGPVDQLEEEARDA
jgi:hypothetical protein